MSNYWKPLLLLLFSIILTLYGDTRLCVRKAPLFANETLRPGETRVPTAGMLLWDSGDASTPRAYTVSEFVRTQNGSVCQPPRNGVHYTIATGTYFPLKLFCTNNGTFIFAESRTLGESCEHDEHCVSQSTKPVRCINNSCQSTQIVSLERNAACSERNIKYGFTCGTGLACETKFSGTCQPICNSNTPCPQNMDCISNDFNDSVCIPLKQVGETCNIISQVKSDCISTAYCFTTPENNTCVPKATAGGSCYSIYPHLSCEEGYECSEGTCLLLPDLGQNCGGRAGNRKSPCRNSTFHYCADSGMCEAKKEAGLSCVDSAECISNFCFNQVCYALQPTLGQPCIPFEISCAQNLFCNPSANSSLYKCESQLPSVGFPCNPLAGCANGFSCSLIDYTCYENKRLNEECVDFIQCPSGNCQNGTCRVAKSLGNNCVNATECEAPLLCSFGRCIAPFSIAEGESCTGVVRNDIQLQTYFIAAYHECERKLSCSNGICTKFAPCLLNQTFSLSTACLCKDEISAVNVYNCYWELQNFTNCLNATGKVERVDLPLTQCNVERFEYYNCKFEVLRELFPEKQLGEIPNLVQQNPIARAFHNSTATYTPILLVWFVILLLAL